MNELNLKGLFADDVSSELDQARETAERAEIRTLRDVEMGWIGVGDEGPIWPVH